jgi:NAD+ diphosphatase
MHHVTIPPVTRGAVPGRHSFVFRGTELLVRRVGDRVVPADIHDALRLDMEELLRCQLDRYSSIQGVAVAVNQRHELPRDMAFRGLRPLMNEFDEKLATEAGAALQILSWDWSSQFCGACGSATRTRIGEHAKQCTRCGQLYFPRVSPAVITAVIHNNRILLAHNRRFRDGIYSLIAGFVEPGETLEECVRREVREEVGIRITAITYFGSQPWPFPDALMIAFVARYHSGRITVDDKEIEDAQWFDAFHLPQIPAPGSISRRIIDWFVAKQRPDS